MRNEFYAWIASIVADANEISCEELSGYSKVQEIVEAKMMLCHFCTRAGMSAKSIASHINRTQEAVSHLVRSYNDRYSTSGIFRAVADDVRNRIEMIDK